VSHCVICCLSFDNFNLHAFVFGHLPPILFPLTALVSFCKILQVSQLRFFILSETRFSVSHLSGLLEQTARRGQGRGQGGLVMERARFSLDSRPRSEEELFAPRTLREM
jgi:hypothetical protein